MPDDSEARIEQREYQQANPRTLSEAEETGRAANEWHASPQTMPDDEPTIWRQL